MHITFLSKTGVYLAKYGNIHLAVNASRTQAIADGVRRLLVLLRSKAI